MATSAEQSVSVSKTIAASPQEIFAILSNTEGHVAIDGSGTVRQTIDPIDLTLGTKFGMKMKLGVPYRMKSTVVEFEQDRLIAWCHFAKHRWRYELEDTEEGTVVTETFDWSTSLFPKGIEIMGYPTSHPDNMTKTLEHLESEVLRCRNSD